MRRDAPPRFLAETTDSIDNIVKETPLSIGYFGHNQRSQLAPLLKAQLLVGDTVAILLELGEDADRE
jgi:hypothetical protein